MIEVVLTSVDVIHSFWVPSLAGKVDMIPGRVTRLMLEPERAGIYRGVCAEYCGASHARMGFAVEVMEPTCLRGMAVGPGARSAPLRESDGSRAFVSSGCAACHAVRGTCRSGIDRTRPDAHRQPAHHRRRRAAEYDLTIFERFIANPAAIKPGSLMPPFGSLPPAELRALAVYLKDLQ